MKRERKQYYLICVADFNNNWIWYGDDKKWCFDIDNDSKIGYSNYKTCYKNSEVLATVRYLKTVCEVNFINITKIFYKKGKRFMIDMTFNESNIKNYNKCMKSRKRHDYYAYINRKYY